jgi:UDP-N-acetyl-D-galactosamine dehydrogenase
MIAHSRKVAVVGLGYVGLPVAVAFGRHDETIGFDINTKRIAELKDGKDHTGEVSAAELAETRILYSNQIDELKKADFFIVAVPTPVDDANIPDLTPMLKASISVGQALKKGDIVVYESTVYPGATEEDCVPVLERESGLRSGCDFSVGYSPERINPGDKEHTFTKIRKVVSAQDARTLQIVAEVYGSVVTAGVYCAASIKVAEAAKVIENTQRDLNIALMNELALIFHRMGIDTIDVLQAAGTKWNFLPFRPGLVGGHCIGVDPFYLTHKAQKLGYRPQVILAGRQVNDDMGRFVAQEAIKEMLKAGRPLQGARVGVLGLTFKEDCPDLRNSKVITIIKELRTYGIQPLVHDPLSDPEEARDEYGVDLVELSTLRKLDHIVIAVAHKEYKALTPKQFKQMLVPGGRISDVKCALDRDAMSKVGVVVWRL